MKLYYQEKKNRDIIKQVYFLGNEQFLLLQQILINLPANYFFLLLGKNPISSNYRMCIYFIT